MMRTTLVGLCVLGLLAASTAGAADAVPRDTRLAQAVKTGNTEEALALIARRVDVNAPESDGTTPLHWAVRNNDLAVIDRLLRAGADVKAANRYEVTPMYLACLNGSAPVVDRLVKAGASANATGPLGETALMTCARTGRADAVKVIIEAGASVDAVESWRGQTALMWASAQGHPAAMDALIAAGADVNARSTIVNWERQRTLEPREKWLPPGGLTPLLFAARQGCLECARILVTHGADRNVIDPQGNSAMLTAAINGHFDVVAYLAEAGADPNIADGTGQTPLYAVVDMHSMPESNRPAPKTERNEKTGLEVMRILLDKGADPNAQLRAMRPYRTKLDRGGDGVLGAGTTPLLRAAKGGDIEAIELLIERGADPKLATRNGVNAIMMVAGVGTREEDTTGRYKTEEQIIGTMRVLAAEGADIAGADTQGRTAAHGAAMWGYTDVIRFLHQNGASLDVKDTRGLTPLDTALGKAGGLGFDGRTGAVHEKTAEAIRELVGTATAAAAPAPSTPSP